MAKIATELKAYNIGGKGTKPTSNTKCCTKERAEYFNCKVDGTYSSNQLVPESVLTPAVVTTPRTVNFSGSLGFHDYGPYSISLNPNTPYISRILMTISITTPYNGSVSLGPFVNTESLPDSQPESYVYVGRTNTTYRNEISRQPVSKILLADDTGITMKTIRLTPAGYSYYDYENKQFILPGSIDDTCYIQASVRFNFGSGWSQTFTATDDVVFRPIEIPVRYTFDKLDPINIDISCIYEIIPRS